MDQGAKMTIEQRDKLMSLIYTYGRASEELGAVPSSLYWNSAYYKQIAAETAIKDFLNSVNTESK